MPQIFGRHYTSYILWLPETLWWRPVNLNGVYNYGGSLDVRARSSGSSILALYRASVTYSRLAVGVTDSPLPSHEQLPFAPVLSGFAEVKTIFGNWSVLGQVRFSGQQSTGYDGTTGQAQFAVGRAAVTYQYKTTAMTLACENIANTIIPNDFGLYSPLRRLHLTLHHQFNCKE